MRSGSLACGGLGVGCQYAGSYHYVRVRPIRVCALRTNVQILNSMATLGCPFGDSQRTLCNCFKVRDVEVGDVTGPGMRLIRIVL